LRGRGSNPLNGSACDGTMNPAASEALTARNYLFEPFAMRIATSRRSNPPRRRSSDTVPITVRPARADTEIANAIARNTEPAPEAIARALTWGADEKVLLALAAMGWLVSRGRSEPLRRAGNHALLVTVMASLLPHALKRVFNQTRPDRMTVVGHIHGVAFSGKREDAFPSGHALHMGALASAAGPLPTRSRLAIQALAVGLSLTRIAVLAHWTSDVVAGFALGAALERLLRLWTGYPLETFREDNHAD
jgi:membrane-associated phospholipid phosphatase